MEDSASSLPVQIRNKDHKDEQGYYDRHWESNVEYNEDPILR